MSDEVNPEAPDNTPDEVDEGLAFAYGENSPAESAPSVIQRIGEITGSKPQVLLRDEPSGDTAMLKPLGPNDRVRAGKYVVQGELGRGGVGTVNKGHDQDLGRDVAMKFLHARFKDEPAILHRFVEEAQIGGQLQHPGIVPVYDLGLVDGKPFFAMKLVKGQTLAKKLADRRTPADDRRSFLAIFEDVCQTLAYAHARGVVHRDLKPANIMIGSFGEVQVVDWGMGKVLPSGGVADERFAAERQAELSAIETVRSGGHGTQSIMGSVMGTPAYMPPEQARGDVDAMDERSDVFALGAILCEVLTGQPPYVGERDELIAMAAMAELDDAHTRLAACDAEPEMVELATRCLMPAPAERPRSAQVVAKAVHDHLAAVEARVHEARVEAAEARVRATALKRTQTLGIGLTVVIAAGLFVSLWFWRAADHAAKSEALARRAAVASAENERLARADAVASAEEARRNEQQAVEQTEIAQRELARAVEIKNLITEMLNSVTPEQAQGADITLLKGILDTASGRLAEGAIEDELVAAELHALTGKVYSAIGLYPEAEQHLPVAVEIWKSALGPEHANTLKSMNDLAILQRGQGRNGESEELLLQVLETRRRVLGEHHPSTMRSMEDLATVYLQQGRYADSESLHLEVREARRLVLGADHPDTIQGGTNLANVYFQLGRFSEAEALYARSLESLERVLGEQHPNTINCMGNLAMAYDKQGRYAEGEALYLQVIDLKRRVLGEEHPETLTNMSQLATNYRGQRRFAESAALGLEALELQKRVLGEEHQDTLVTMSTLASNYSELGRNDEATSLFERTLEIERRTLGEEHPFTLGTMVGLATHYLQQRQLDQAEPLYVEALEIERRVLGERHPSTMETMGNLALLYKDQGRLAEAVPLELEVLKNFKRELGEEHPNTLGVMTNLGSTYNKLGRFEDAANVLEDSVAGKRRVLGMGHPWTRFAMRSLVTAYVALDRTDDALPLQRELFERELAPAEAPDATAEALVTAARSLLTHEVPGLRDPERALGFADRAAGLAMRADSDYVWVYLDTLALAQYRVGDVDAAAETQRRALALMPEGADPTVGARLAEYESAAKGE